MLLSQATVLSTVDGPRRSDVCARPREPLRRVSLLLCTGQPAPVLSRAVQGAAWELLGVQLRPVPVEGAPPSPPQCVSNMPTPRSCPLRYNRGASCLELRCMRSAGRHGALLNRTRGAWALFNHSDNHISSNHVAIWTVRLPASPSQMKHAIGGLPTTTRNLKDPELATGLVRWDRRASPPTLRSNRARD